MKKIIALLLALLTFLSMLTCLTGCNSNEKNITKGELINLICDSFGMSSFTKQEPYTNTVKKDNKYFTSVQAAYEWEIIDDKDINLDEKVDKDFLSSTLIKSVGSEDISNKSKEEITKFAVDNGYVDFSYKGRTDGMRYVTYDEAVSSLYKSTKMWSDRTYSTPKEEVVYGENTHNFTSDETKTSTSADGSLTIPKSKAESMKIGDTYIAYDSKDNSQKLYKVKDIAVNGDNVTIVPETETPTLESAIQDMDASGNVAPNLTSCNITDGLGNPLQPDGEVINQSNAFSSAVATPLGFAGNDASVENCAKGKFAINFKIDGIAISGSVSPDKISFKAKGDLYANKSKTLKVSVDKSYDIKDISLDYDYDIKWFKLKYAYAKLNYTTVDTTKVGVKYEKSKYKDWTLKEFDNLKLAQSIHSNLSDLQGKAGKTIKICDVPVMTNGVMSFNIVVQLKFSISGEVSLVVTTSNAKGIEYKNGNIRYIKEEKKDTDIKLTAKAELTLYIGASFKALGINIVGLGLEGGIGAKGSVIIHVTDQENHLLTELNTEVELSVAENELSALSGVSFTAKGGTKTTLKAQICFDYKVYSILKFTLDSESVIGKILKGTEIEFYGEKNATIDKLCGHIEDGVNVKKCTREFKIEDEEEKENTEDNKPSTEDNKPSTEEDKPSTGENNSPDADKNSDVFIDNEALDINTYFISLSINESQSIKIEKLPSGYTNNDVVFKSSNSEIVRTDNSGRITAVNPGNAIISVETKDGKYKQQCSIYVIRDNSTITFEPLSNIYNILEGVNI